MFTSNNKLGSVVGHSSSIACDTCIMTRMPCCQIAEHQIANKLVLLLMNISLLR